MSSGSLGVLALGLYLLGLVAVAEWARRARRDASLADHFLAARDLGTVVLFLTLYSTAYSGNSLLGYPGQAYRSGFSFVMATGFMLAIVVVFHGLAPKLRPLAVARGYVTPGDFLRDRFGDSPTARTLVRLAGALMAIALLNFLLAQLKAMGHVTGRMTAGAVPYELGVLGLAGMVLFYETLGGMRAVAWTDAAQGILMLFGLGVLLAWLVSDAGGLAGVTLAVQRARPEAVARPDAATCANWLSSILLLGLASVLYPQAVQRVFAARSARALRHSFALMSFMPLVTTWVVTLIGVAAIPRISGVRGVASDEVMPMLLSEWASSGPLAAVAAVVVFIGALAAIMSTADSCLLSLGSLVARDLLDRPAAQGDTTRLGKRAAAVLLLAVVPLALVRELTLWRLIELKMELLVQCVPAFLIALHWRGLRVGPVLAGLVVGALFAVTLTLGGWPRLAGVHVGVIGLGLNALVAVAGSWLGGREGGVGATLASPGKGEGRLTGGAPGGPGPSSP